MEVVQGYAGSTWTLTWTNKTVGSDIAPTSVLDPMGNVRDATLPIPVEQAKSIEVEVDTLVTASHVASSVDLNVYGGLTPAVSGKQTTRRTGVDAVVADRVAPLTITPGVPYLWFTLDHNDGTSRADVVVRVFVRN
jgi:hypothetical protein